MIKIRAAEIKDCAEILKLLRNTPELQGSEMKVDSEYTPEYVLDSVKDKKANCVLIAEDNKKVIGVLTAEIFKKKGYSYFTDIAILKSYRGKGIGTQLYQQYEKIAIKNKASTIAGITQVNNKAMHNFCEKNGLKLGEQRFYFQKKLD